MDNPLDSDDTQPKSAQARPVPATDASVLPGDTAIAEAAPEPKGPVSGKRAKKKSGKVWLFVVLLVIVLAAAGGGTFYVMMRSQNPIAKLETAAAVKPEGPLAPYAKGSIAHLNTLAQPKTIDNIPFIDRDKKALHLSDFKGQVVILNVWATWCAPCRFEMPTLAHLQTEYAGKGLKVLPLSVDTEDKFDDVKSFMDVQDPLDVYADTKFAAPSKFSIQGMPATLILDKQGREVARLDGEATWDTPEVKALVDKLLSE